MSETIDDVNRALRRLQKKLDEIREFRVLYALHGNEAGHEDEYLGMIDCPFNDPLHYHHDDCPSCFAEECEKRGGRALRDEGFA